MLDDVLSHAIIQGFGFEITPKAIEHIFRFNGPLGSFSHRMEIALYFGLIEDETYQQLDIVREMRNACAHSKHPLTFKSPELAAVALRLFTPPLGFVPTKAAQQDMKEAFSAEISFLGAVLSHGSRAAAKELAQSYILEAMAERSAVRDGPPKR